MKNKLLSFLGFATMSLGLLSGCGFVEEEEPLMIAAISSQVLEDGQTMVVITYSNEDTQPTIFHLPKGEDGEIGKDGVGISSFEYEKDNYGNYDLTIKFTDASIEPVELKLTNGISISNVGTQVNEEIGETELVIYYSNGTKSEPLVLPKGDDGKDGVGIINFLQVPNEDGSSQLMFAMSNGKIYTCDIPAPEKGESGRGIAAMISYEEGNYYCIKITYTDDSEPQILKFDKPNQWINGSEEPTTSIGRNGDFYFNQSKNTIYLKIEGVWVKQVDFDDLQGNTYTVSFDLNADDAEFLQGYGYQSTYIINDGETFASSNKNVPIPYRQGYTFVGWYTSANPTVVHGTFTDLTPVNSDFTLYAKWEIKE